MPPSTTTYRWNIEKFSKLPKTPYYSPNFEIGGFLWRLEMHPPGYSSKKGKDYVGIFLKFVDARITPDEDCPSASVRFVAVSKKNGSASVQSTVQHAFTRHAPDWGFAKFIPMGNLMDRKAGLLTRDTLHLTVTIDILKHPPKGSQSLVFFDVGGKTFKMDEETLARYPDSKLPKMVKEFRALVHKGTAIFIDRNPTTFPWIQEIYRDGNYETQLPLASKKLLQKELDFFELPSLEKLGI